MAAQIGRNFLLKIGTGTGTTTVASLKSTSFSVNGAAVDVTTKDSNGFRDLLGSAGESSISLSAAGVMAGGTQDSFFINNVLAKSIGTYTLAFGTGNSIVGAFQTTKYDAAGEYNGAQTYSISLESSGSMTVV